MATRFQTGSERGKTLFYQEPVAFTRKTWPAGEYQKAAGLMFSGSVSIPQQRFKSTNLQSHPMRRLVFLIICGLSLGGCTLLTGCNSKETPDALSIHLAEKRKA